MLAATNGTEVVICLSCHPDHPPDLVVMVCDPRRSFYVVVVAVDVVAELFL